jgi:hypothetical protein
MICSGRRYCGDAGNYIKKWGWNIRESLRFIRRFILLTFIPFQQHIKLWWFRCHLWILREYDEENHKMWWFLEGI